MKSTRDHGPEEPHSTLYIATSATLAAVILVLTIFLLIRGFQWRAALADLRAEPGIEILNVERSGFFKKRILGLKDPLAPSPEALLRKHNIGPRSVEVALTEYHSLNTPYEIERQETREASGEELKESLIDAVAEYTDKIQSQRKSDLEKITRMLFNAKFPEEMKTVDIEWVDGKWIVEGELFEPVHSRFSKAVPENIIEGEVDLSRLANLTTDRSASLGAQIASTNLLNTDIDGKFTHIDQVVRLLADYDEVCEISRMPPPRLQLEVVSREEGEEDLRIAALWKELTEGGRVDPNRFEETILILAEKSEITDSESEPDLVAFLKLLPEDE